MSIILGWPGSVLLSCLALTLGCLLIGFFITKGTLKKIFRAFIVTLSVISFLGFLILLSGMQRDQCIDNENRMIVVMLVLAVILFGASIILVTKRK